MEGFVARLFQDKGFGFIQEAETKQEYFFHRSGVKGILFESLKEKDKVYFEEEDSSKGPRATDVRPR